MENKLSTLFQQEFGKSVKILGLDLGVSSIGWALLEHTVGNDDEGNDDAGQLIAAGSHIYQPPFKLKESTETAKVYKNADRRKARGMRRRTERIRMRLDHLTKILRENQMLPKAGAEWDALFFDHDIHPLALRTKGLDEELSLYEFGRCLYHICKRRGFLSNKGTKVLDLGVKRQKGRPVEVIGLDPEIQAVIDAIEKQKEKPTKEADEDGDEPAKKAKKDDAGDDNEGQVLAAISELRGQIQEKKCRSLGEYLFHLMEAKAEDGKWASFNRVRGTRTARDMYESEFNLLWERQAKVHQKLNSDALKAQVRNAIFFQRPLKIQRFLVGSCTFEPNRKRARAGYPIAQEFRLWQDLNNLKIEGRRFDKKGNRTEYAPGLFSKDETDAFDMPATRPLTLEEKQKLADILQVESHQTWNQIKKAIGLSTSQCDFNLERSKSKGLEGAKTRAMIEKTVPGLWQKLLDGKIEFTTGNKVRKLTVDNLIEDLFSIVDSGALLKHLRNYYGLSAHDAYLLSILELPAGVMGLSSAAMRKILYYMKQGLGKTDASAAAGYKRRDEQVTEGLPKIPWEALASDLTRADKGGRRRPKVTNPAVSKCLFQTRKVVNKIIFEHGMPDIIRIELAREMRNTKKDREAIQKAQRENEKIRKEAAKQLEGLGMNPENQADLLKYQLWREADGICPYSGRAISLSMLFSANTEVDHIIPWSISLDDSFKNKVVCVAEENRAKSNRTPFAAYGANREKYQLIIDRVTSNRMSKYKKSLFAYGSPKDRRGSLPEAEALEFAAGRLLSDTTFITREAKEMLLLLGCSVEPVKGGTTAVIRRKWGLNPILQKPDPETGEVLNEKNRDDHRHHAIDAIVIALTDIRLMQRLSRISSRIGGVALGQHGLRIPDPWKGFRSDVEKVIKEMIVTHEPNRKVTGGLTEETVYGLDLKRMERTFRKGVAALTPKMVGQIRNPDLRARIEAAIKSAGKDAKAAFPDGRLEYMLPNGKKVVVKTVLCAESVAGKVKLNAATGEVEKWPGYAPFRNREGKVIGWRATGGNHHLAIYEKKDGSRWAEAISLYEATERRRRGDKVYQDAENGDRLLMALHKGDIVSCAQREGGETAFRVGSFSTDPRLYLVLRLPCDALTDQDSLLPCGGIRIQSGQYLSILAAPPKT